MNQEEMIKNQNQSDESEAKWYVITTIYGNEDTVYQNLKDKVNAYNLDDVKDLRLIKTKEITVEVFDPINNPPPSRFVNSKTITWETLPGNKYKKTRTRMINRFPGYIYIKMIMNDEAWYIIRNTIGVTGFVGSSGKGAKPIPMSDFEVNNLFDPANNQDIIINKTPDVFVEITVEKPKEEIKPIEFLEKMEDVSLINQEGFFDSTLKEKQEIKSEQLIEEKETNFIQTDLKPENTESELEVELNIDLEAENLNLTTVSETVIKQNEIESNQYLTDHIQSQTNTVINEPEVNQEKNDTTLTDIFDKGYSKNEKPFVVGNNVIILSGQMEGTEGIIDKINYETKKVKVLVNMLGREIPINLTFDDIKKQK